MVRGTGRRVIVVRSPDPQVFEEAIFVLREDWTRKQNADQVVEEARRAVSDYLRRHAAPRRASRWWIGLVAAAVILVLAAAWAVLRLRGAV